MSDPTKRTVAVIRFYNHLTDQEIQDITEIPESRLLILTDIPYIEMCKPFIIRDLGKGLSRAFLSERYGISEAVIRRIGFEAGLLESPGY